MSRHGNKSKTHILIPAGTVNPNESAILEVSLDGGHKNTLVAKRGPHHSPNRTRHGKEMWTSMDYSDFESGLRDETHRTQASFMNSTMTRNEPTRPPMGFMNSTMPRNEPTRPSVGFVNNTTQSPRYEPPRTDFMPSTTPNYTSPPTTFNPPSLDPLEQTEVEERQALLSQLQEYQRARRQYLASAAPAAAVNIPLNLPGAPNVPQTPRSIACQACCTYRTMATQTKDSFPCMETRSGPNLRTTGISLNFPPFPTQAWNAPGCSGKPPVSSCKVRPCYSDTENGSNEYCELCDKVYNVLNEDKSNDTVELWRNCSATQSSSVPSDTKNVCACIMSQREVEKVARRFEEIRAKLGICKSLISNKVTGNEDAKRICTSRSWYEPKGRKMNSYETPFETGGTEQDDAFERMLQESEKLFKRQKELLQQTRQQLLNERNRYQQESLESCSGYSLSSSPATSKSILTKRCVTVSPDVKTFSTEGKTSWAEMRTCPSDARFSPPETRYYGQQQRNVEPKRSPHANERYSQDTRKEATRNVAVESRSLRENETRRCAAGPKNLPPETSSTPPEATPPGTPGNQPCNRPRCPHGKKMKDLQFDSEKQFAYDLGKVNSKVGTMGYDDLYQGRCGLDENKTTTKGNDRPAVRQERTGVPFDENEGENADHTLCGIDGIKCPYKHTNTP